MCAGLPQTTEPLNRMWWQLGGGRKRWKGGKGGRNGGKNVVREGDRSVSEIGRRKEEW